MVNDSNLFGFGCFLTAVSITLILNVLGSKTKTAAKTITQLPTQQSDRPDTHRVSELEQQCLHLCEELRALHQQCSRLRHELQQQKTLLKADFQEVTFDRLQTLLTNYPTALKMVEVNPNLPAKNLLALLSSLETLLHDWNIEPIGIVWAQTPYNPQLHQPDSNDIAAGEAVYIRYVGYRQGDRILYPAKVSRTLPAGARSAV